LEPVAVLRGVRNGEMRPLIIDRMA